MTSAPRIPELVAEGSVTSDLGKLFAAAGHELWLVGGPVRDFFLNRKTVDLDFATDAKPSEMLAILRPVAQQLWMQGVAFGTIGALVVGSAC